MGVSVFVGCSSEEDFHPSIFSSTDEEAGRTELDQWIWDEFTSKYNIEIKYRWDDFEANQEYVLVPPMEEKVRPFLETIIKGWIEPYEASTAGPTFFKEMSPKQIMLIGSAGYNADGTFLLGEAERGNKITMFNLNGSDPTKANILELNLHNFHHEFIHVLHQTIEIPEAYELLSTADYTTDWSSMTSPNKKGFISKYAAMDVDEDFAEMIAWFIHDDEALWQQRLAAGGDSYGSTILKTKEQIILNYMRNNWKIDLYQIRAAVKNAKDEITGAN